MSRALVWFRRDLRFEHNPALDRARREHDEVLCLFVVDAVLMGAASTRRRDQLAGYVHALDVELSERGGGLTVVAGDPVAVVPEVARRHDIAAVYWNADTTPYAGRRDTAVAAALGVPVIQTWGTLVHPPGSVLTAKGTLSQVFTPFYKRWVQTALDPDGTVGQGQLLPAAAAANDLADSAPPTLDPGSAAVARRVDDFAARVDRYADHRDRLDVEGTSGLSVDLRFGAVSPRRLLDRFANVPGGEPFVRQLSWRDWYAHMLAERPDLPDAPLKPQYSAIAWRNDAAEFAAWCEARTGYPVVDAAMRQLDETGVVHNRARMIVASFLVKHLLVDWRWGERHYRRHLLDGEIANNAGNWQWVAGTGADAAPYFRIFNPISQSQKFDPTGTYLRRFLPELAELDNTAIHFPADAGPLELAAAGVILGDTYPEPIVDHRAARERCLDAYKAAVK